MTITPCAPESVLLKAWPWVSMAIVAPACTRPASLIMVPLRTSSVASAASVPRALLNICCRLSTSHVRADDGSCLVGDAIAGQAERLRRFDTSRRVVEDAAGRFGDERAVLRCDRPLRVVEGARDDPGSPSGGQRPAGIVDVLEDAKPQVPERAVIRP